MVFTPRSEGTRRAILTAARRSLCSIGYEATTIRSVAAAAGVDASMVMRYYGSKAGLFNAAVDLDLRLPPTSECSPDELGGMLAHHFVARWEGDLSDEVATMLLRSAPTQPEAAEHIRGVFRTQILRLVREVLGDAPDIPERVAMLSAQLLGVALCRYILLIPPMVAMDRDVLSANLAPVLQHYLTGDLREPVRSDSPQPPRT